jgi:hypothetical protein
LPSSQVSSAPPGNPPRLEKFVKGHRLRDHSFESAFVFLRDIKAGWRKDLSHRVMVAEKANNESLTQSVVDALMREQFPCVD